MTPGRSGCDGRDHGLAVAVRQVHVEEDDVGVELADQRDRIGDRRRLADHVDAGIELAPDARAEEAVVLHEHEAAPWLHERSCGGSSGIRSSTSVPSPGAVRIVAVPPWRATRLSIDSAIPCRSGATALRSKPAPRSRT